jgi:hypothetical protein
MQIYCNEFKNTTYNYVGSISNANDYLQSKFIGINDDKFIKIIIKIINKVKLCYPHNNLHKTDPLNASMFDFIEISHNRTKHIVGLTLIVLWDFYRFKP